MSNRRPTSGVVADSGTATPESDTQRLSLLAHAKREAAKRGLYSKFFRGPILGSHEAESAAELSSFSSPAIEFLPASKGTIELDISKRKLETMVDGEERAKWKRRKKALKEVETLATERSKLERKKEKKGGNSHECSFEDPEGKKARKARRRERQEIKGQAEKVAAVVTTPMKSDDGDQPYEEQDWGVLTPSLYVDTSEKSRKKRRNKSFQFRSTPDGDAKHKKHGPKYP